MLKVVNALRPPEIVVFPLKRLVARMHQRGVVHLDMRNMGNILRDRDGRPHLIDFQSALSFKRFPRRLQAAMRGADLSGVYKSWPCKS